jgi:hypothetical protein
LSSSSDKSEAGTYHAMLLLSTLSAAAEVWSSVAERRAGRDPSSQEDRSVVEPFLRNASRELQQMTMRLRASLVYASSQAEEPDDRRSAAVRRFNDLMTLHRIGRVLHVVHQRLLSLYPEVSERLAEEARLLERRCELLIESEQPDLLDGSGAFMEALFEGERSDLPDEPAGLVESLLVFTAHLQRELAGRWGHRGA